MPNLRYPDSSSPSPNSLCPTSPSPKARVPIDRGAILSNDDSPSHRRILGALSFEVGSRELRLPLAVQKLSSGRSYESKLLRNMRIIQIERNPVPIVFGWVARWFLPKITRSFEFEATERITILQTYSFLLMMWTASGSGKVSKIFKNGRQRNGFFDELNRVLMWKCVPCADARRSFRPGTFLSFDLS